VSELRAIEKASVAGALGEQLLVGARFVVTDNRPIIAYMIVALHDDGTISRSGGTQFADEPGPLNSTLFVAMVGEVAREHLITQPIASDTVNRANGYDD
jgi:hypothetical protein